MTKILIVRTDGIGDVLLSMPVAGVIKQFNQDAEVWLLTRHYTKEIGEHYPDVTGVLTIDNENGSVLSYRNLVNMVRPHNFDYVVLIHPQFFLAAVLAAARIPMRIGTGYRWYSFLFTHKVYEHRKRNIKHEVDYNLNLLQPLGIKSGSGRVTFSVPITIQEKIHELLIQRKISLDKPIIVLHPGSGGSAMEWSIKNYQRLAEKLVEIWDAVIIVTGGNEEAALLQKFHESCRVPVTLLSGLLSLTELAALLQESSLVISNSTGPLHLAVAVGTQVIGLYPPVKLCSPVRWGPYGKDDSVIQPAGPVFKSRSEALKISPDCMDLITVDQVMEMAKRKLISFEKNPLIV